MKSFIREISHVFKHQAAQWLAAPIHWLFGSGPAPCGILMYHRLAEPTPNEPEPTYNVSPKVFRAQLEGLLACGYQPFSLRDVLTCIRCGCEIPRRSFVVTFDDCYDHVFDVAYPILQRLNIPATLFISTAYLDSTEPFPFDDWEAKGKPTVPQSSWLPVTTAHCQEMLSSGLIDLGAHTHTHQDFRGRPAEFQADMEENVAELAKRFGIRHPTFAFPYGTVELGYTAPDLVAGVHASGAICALTTDRHAVTLDSDPYQIGRFIAEDFDTPLSLQFKLSGWYSGLRSIWQSCKRWMMPWRWFASNSEKAVQAESPEKLNEAKPAIAVQPTVDPSN